MKNALDMMATLYFDKHSGKLLRYQSSDLHLFTANTYYTGSITESCANTYHVHPSCLVFQEQSPTIDVYNSSILSTAKKYPDGFTLVTKLDISKLVSGINTNIKKQSQDQITIQGAVNDKAPSEWDKLYWVDLAAKYPSSPDLLTTINNSTLGLSSINGIHQTIIFQGSPSVSLDFSQSTKHPGTIQTIDISVPVKQQSTDNV